MRCEYHSPASLCSSWCCGAKWSLYSEYLSLQPLQLPFSVPSSSNKYLLWAKISISHHEKYKRRKECKALVHKEVKSSIETRKALLKPWKRNEASGALSMCLFDPGVQQSLVTAGLPQQYLPLEPYTGLWLERGIQGCRSWPRVFWVQAVGFLGQGRPVIPSGSLQRHSSYSRQFLNWKMPIQQVSTWLFKMA